MTGIPFSEAAQLSTDKYCSMYLLYDSDDWEWCLESIKHNDNWSECVKKAKEERTEATTEEEFHALVMKYYEPEIESMAQEMKTIALSHMTITEEEFEQDLIAFQKKYR